MHVTQCNSISILGSGWLGQALARMLHQHARQVTCSARSPEAVARLAADGLHAVRCELTRNGFNAEASFLDSDCLVVCIPPGRSEDVETRHPAEIRALVQALRRAACRRVIFISSTSVYGSHGQVADEADPLPPDKASGRALRSAEHVLLAEDGLEVTVLRLAGLIGPGRQPGRFLAGKRQLKNGSAPVNLVHRDDVIRAVLLLLDNPRPGEVFNLAAPAHPIRKDYYTRAARALGLPPPEFEANTDSSWKIISSEKMITLLGFHFLYPDPTQVLEDEGEIFH
jgi:nucleoside-diphosphate-sugar epimerase